MNIIDLRDTEGRTYPARRETKNLVGGMAPLRAEGFCMGQAVLAPEGGQVPWHNHEQEEVYFILQGTGEMCIGETRRVLRAGQAVYIPPRAYHQLTNIGDEPLRMMYCYAPAGDVAHWKQELGGTLPRAGEQAPPLPEGARPQITAVFDT